MVAPAESASGWSCRNPLACREPTERSKRLERPRARSRSVLAFRASQERRLPAVDGFVPPAQLRLLLLSSPCSVHFSFRSVHLFRIAGRHRAAPHTLSRGDELFLLLHPLSRLSDRTAGCSGGRAGDPRADDQEQRNRRLQGQRREPLPPRRTASWRGV